MSTTSFYESFGSGILVAKGLVTNAQPIMFGALQDVALDISGTTKTLFGQGQFPIAAGRGEIKMTGTAKIGQISGPLYNSLFFGGSGAIGTTSAAYSEAHSIPASPYTITVTNASTYVEDLGVVYTATGVPLIPVTSAPATGQYAVNTTTGIYTFAAADTTLGVQISYTYTQATVGSTLTLGNPLQGVQPIFEVIISRGYNGTGERFKLWSCISSKLTLPTKMADFAISDLAFECFANAAGQTITVYTDV